MTWEERQERRRTRTLRRNCATRSWLGGSLLIGLGTLLFLDNLGWLAPGQLWSFFWPMLLLAFGIWKLSCQSRGGGAALVGGIAVLFGLFFLLTSFGVFHIHLRNGSWAPAVVLILLGVMALRKALERRPIGNVQNSSVAVTTGFERAPNAARTKQQSEPVYLDDWVLLGGKKRRIEAAEFRGGDVYCVLGELILDLRNVYRAQAEGLMLLEVHCVLGSVHFKVPQDWLVQMEGSTVLGGFQDKTIPVRGVDERPPVLVIQGGAYLGEIIVDS